MQVEAGNEPRCFGSELVKIQEDEDIDDEKAINILAMLIGAGADTTSSVLQSFFKVMALNPGATRAAQEGKRVIPSQTVAFFFFLLTQNYRA